MIDYHQEPREIYTQVIFIDNKFNQEAILRSIHILNPANEQTYPSNNQYSLEELKRITWTAVNAEVRPTHTNTLFK